MDHKRSTVVALAFVAMLTGISRAELGSATAVVLIDPAGVARDAKLGASLVRLGFAAVENACYKARIENKVLKVCITGEGYLLDENFDSGETHPQYVSKNGSDAMEAVLNWVRTRGAVQTL